MAIKYRGEGSTQEVSIFLYGDGISSSVGIDLSKAPFGLDFRGQLPSIAYLIKEQPGTAPYPDLTAITVVQPGLLNLQFESPLPAVTYSRPDEVGGPSTAINLTVRFIYG